MHRYVTPILLLVSLASLAACSDDDPAGSGGSSATGGAGAAGGSGGAGAMGGSGGAGAAGGTGGGTTCDLFDGTSCADFLDGCWAPDLTGTCTDSGTELMWSDGHQIVRLGNGPGLYGPSDTTPCITLDFDGSTNTSTLTKVSSGDVLLNQDNGDGTILITCPMGDEHTFTVAELQADNVCKGIECE